MDTTEMEKESKKAIFREHRRLYMQQWREKQKDNPEYKEKVTAKNKIYTQQRKEREQGENSRWNKLKANNPQKFEENLRKAKEKRDEYRANNPPKKTGRKPIDFTLVDPDKLSPWGKLKLYNPGKYEELLQKRRDRYYKNNTNDDINFIK